MTAKRFHYRVDEVGIYYYICDNTKKGDDRIILELGTKYDAIEVCDVLNSLNDENERLKQAYNDAKKDVEKKEQILKDIMKDNLLIQDMKRS